MNSTLRTRTITPKPMTGRRSGILPYLDYRPDPELLGLYEENDNSEKLRAMAHAAREALTRLTPRQREAVTLICFEGISQKELAERWGVTPSAVSHLLDRAYTAMRKLIIVT